MYWAQKGWMGDLSVWSLLLVCRDHPRWTRNKQALSKFRARNKLQFSRAGTSGVLVVVARSANDRNIDKLFKLFIWQSLHWLPWLVSKCFLWKRLAQTLYVLRFNCANSKLFSTAANLYMIVTERKLWGLAGGVKEREAGAPISCNSRQLWADSECITRPNNFARSHSL